MRFIVLFICLVCVYDIYLTVKYSDTLDLLEQNSVAGVLISKDEIPRRPYTMPRPDPKVDVSKLVAFKCLGLLAAADILEWMVRKDTGWSLSVIWAMALIQTLLLFYLVY
jgi:uncharacterized membrane protein